MRAEIRELSLITARMSKERKLSLKKGNLVEVVIIHVVAVEVLFADETEPRRGGNQLSFCKLGVSQKSNDGIKSIY